MHLQKETAHNMQMKHYFPENPGHKMQLIKNSLIIYATRQSDPAELCAQNRCLHNTKMLSFPVCACGYNGKLFLYWRSKVSGLLVHNTR